MAQTITKRSDYDATGARIPKPIGAASVVYFDDGGVLVTMRAKGIGCDFHTGSFDRIRAVGEAMGVPSAAIDAVCAEANRTFPAPEYLRDVEESGPRQQYWMICGREYVISHARCPEIHGFETMIFYSHDVSFIGDEVWQDRSDTAFIDHAEAARLFDAELRGEVAV